MRRFRRLQDRCQNTIAPGERFLREKFSSSNENPHGFELPRTLSGTPYPNLRSPISDVRSSFHRYAQRSDVATAVESSDRNRVLAG